MFIVVIIVSRLETMRVCHDQCGAGCGRAFNVTSRSGVIFYGGVGVVFFVLHPGSSRECVLCGILISEDSTVCVCVCVCDKLV